MNRHIRRGLWLVICLAFWGHSILAQTTEFSYQGNLNVGGVPANGVYDFELALFDSAIGGIQLGALNTRNNVTVSNGSFTLSLDFGDQFPGADRFLEIRVRTAGGGSYTTLAPRQKIASVPYAVQSVNAANALTATNAQSLGGMSADQYVLTGDSRLSDARNPLPNSSNYIQNTTVQQSPSNFNVSGTGTANIFSATTQFNIGGNRVFSTPGNENIFGGVGAGSSNVYGVQTGTRNSFIGGGAGFFNTTGYGNSFFGFSAGQINTTGWGNTFVGLYAGNDNSTGSYNSAFGGLARLASPDLTNANAFGAFALVTQSNSLVLGSINGTNGANADTNVGIGITAPSARFHVRGNSLFQGNITIQAQTQTPVDLLVYGNGWYGGDVTVVGTLNASLPVTNVTGILPVAKGGTGLGSAGTTGNFLRSVAGIWTSEPLLSTDIPGGSGMYIQNQLSAPQSLSEFWISGRGQANIFDAGQQFALNGVRILNAPGTDNIFVGPGAGTVVTGGSFNSYFGANAGNSTTVGIGNVFVGSGAGRNNTMGSNNIFIGKNAGFQSSTANSNLFVGGDAGYANLSGTSNIFVGEQAGYSNTGGSNNSFFGFRSGLSSTGFGNSFFGRDSGLLNGGGSDNSFFGYLAGGQNVLGTNNSALGKSADVLTPNLSYATVIGAGAIVAASNQVQLGRTGLDTVSVGTLAAAGSTPVCILGTVLASCSSSVRYKENVRNFFGGLDVLRRLRPVSFDWKERKESDLGFIAEDVAKVDRRLTYSNPDGRTEGIKYAQVTVVLVNAINEQQAQIETQQRQIKDQQERIGKQDELLKKQQAELDALKKLICSQNPSAEFCKPKE